MKITLPKSAKEVKVWLKKLGIRRLEVAKMAVYRDSLAAKVMKAVAKRDYDGARYLLELASKAQDCIETNQNTLDAIDKACR